MKDFYRIKIDASFDKIYKVKFLLIHIVNYFKKINKNSFR